MIEKPYRLLKSLTRRRTLSDLTRMRADNVQTGELVSANRDNSSPVGKRDNVTPLDPQRLEANLHEVDRLASDIVQNPSSQTAVTLSEAMAALRQACADGQADRGDPVWVLSTGRCGTLALQRFLETEPSTMPYHRNSSAVFPQTESTLLFHRFMSGHFDRDVIERAMLQAFVRHAMDHLRAAQQGRQFVAVSHAPTPAAPLLKAVYPGSRFINLKRDYSNVFLSYLTKQQFFGQTEAMALTVTGKSIELADPGYDLTERIVWYLRAIDVFATGFLAVLPPAAGAVIESEALFAGADDVHATLADMFPGLQCTPTELKQIFKKKVNMKLGKYEPMVAAERQQILDRVNVLWTKLQQNGVYAKTR